MDINLTVYDMNNFLDKYTRFMTKDIYISNKMYFNFLKQYDYLYQTLKKDCFLYNNNKKYKRIMDIFDKKKDLLKLHNQKYLQRALSHNQSFFEKISLDDKVNTRIKTIILAEEENTYVVQRRNEVNLIVGKLKYLIDCKNYHVQNILILVSNQEQVELIKNGCIKNNLHLILDTYQHYGKKMLGEETLLDDNGKYSILIQYIMNDLFSDKDKFNSFLNAFSKYIYLNKEYYEYDTFKDYHNYMYKRKYLASNLSLKEFEKQEIQKRKKYLRTIQNESMKQKELVDIANFLYLNSIDYCYDVEHEIFKIKNGRYMHYIQYLDIKESLEEKSTDVGKTIYLYASYMEDKTYLEVLAYELIKRRYPLELVNEDDLYDQLKKTNIDNYFSEFIYKYLIPLINYYEENKTLTNINISTFAQKEFLKLYDRYIDYLKEHHFITEIELLRRIEQEILSSKYKYLFLWGDIPLKCHIPTFTIVDNYQETELLKENIKLLYDYKKYLFSHQTIPIMHTYLSKSEINYLTQSFLKDNLAIINKSLEETKKEIKIYEYSDSNRLHVYHNISNCCANILEYQSKNTIIGVKQLKDINILIGNNQFMKLDKNTLLTKDKIKIKVKEILKIDRLYDTVVLPYLIMDKFHDDLFCSNYQYNIKVMLYVSLHKCRQNLILLCPTSKSKELNRLLGNLKKQVIKG